MCDEAGLHIHLRVETANGGDSLKIVQETVRSLRKRSGKREIKDGVVLLDADRIAQDLRAGKDAAAAAARSGFELILMTPNLEGLLLRLHPDREQSKPDAKRAERELRRLWHDYTKPPDVRQLKLRFQLPDLQRAAKHDDQLRTLLGIIGL